MLLLWPCSSFEWCPNKFFSPTLGAKVKFLAQTIVFVIPPQKLGTTTNKLYTFHQVILLSYFEPTDCKKPKFSYYTPIYSQSFIGSGCFWIDGARLGRGRGWVEIGLWYIKSLHVIIDFGLPISRANIKIWMMWRPILFWMI